LDSLLLVLALVLLAAAAVVFAATPAETPAIKGPGGPAPSVGVSGDGLAFETTVADPFNGAWRNGQATWVACQANDRFPPEAQFDSPSIP
jgi:hypothetical protein